jgi:hypothetical protein
LWYDLSTKAKGEVVMEEIKKVLMHVGKEFLVEVTKLLGEKIVSATEQIQKPKVIDVEKQRK